MPSQQEYIAQLRKSLVARHLQAISQNGEPSAWEIEQVQKAVDALSADQLRNHFSREPFLDPEHKSPQDQPMCGPAS